MSDDAHVFDHERSDVAPKWPIMIGAGVLLLLPITIALIALLLHTIWAPVAAPDAAPRVTMPAARNDAPRLQTRPQADLAHLQQQWDERLHGTGWVDREAGIVHVPIEQAKQRLVAEGLSRNTRLPPPSRAGGESATGITQPQGGAEGSSTVDRAGDASERRARNDDEAAQAVPYRAQEMAR